MATWEPTAEDLARILEEQNPWHRTGDVPDALAPLHERSLVGGLVERVASAEPDRFQIILGHRRVGKTTVMYHLVRRLLATGVPARRVWWHRLDHPLLMELPLGELVRFTIERAQATADAPAFVFLDEVVYARHWDRWLKTFYDERWPIRVLATSSATAALRDRRTESGVGRWEEQYLSPYLLGEYLALQQRSVSLPVERSLGETVEASLLRAPELPDVSDDRRRLMLVGGFPELLTTPASDDERSDVLRAQRTLRSDAVERAVYKDIPQSFGIDSPMQLERLLYTLAGQMTGILSPASLTSDLGMSQPTLDRYIGYLEQAFLTFVAPNFSGSEAKVQRRGRKLYFVDGAVRNAALQRGLAPLTNPDELGLLTENLVAGHLRALAALTQVRLHHWRSGPREVDLIYDHPERPIAFEVGSSSTHRRDGLRAFVDANRRFAGRSYLVAPDAPAISAERAGGVGTLPLDLLLLAISANAARAQAARLAATPRSSY